MLRLGFLIFFLLIYSNLNSQTWEQIGNTPFVKHHSNGFGYEGRAYVIEGTGNDDNVSNEVWQYLPSDNSWEQIEDFPGPSRSIAIGDEWNNKYYYGFGSGQNSVLNDLWVFDPTNQSWEELPTCPCEGRTHPALVAHNDKVFVGSGSTFENDLNDWWELDLNTNEWTQKLNIPGQRRHHPFFFALEDKIYVGGGHAFNWIEYDMNEETWIEIDGLPEGRVAGTQFEYKGNGYILAGDDFQHRHVPSWQNFMRFNDDLKEWEELPPVPENGRWAPSSFILNDFIYLFGGATTNDDDTASPLNASMWRFDLTYTECLPPSKLEAMNIDTTNVDLFWRNNSGGADTLKWRKASDQEWNVAINPTALFPLESLEICTEYEFVVIGNCDTLVTESIVYNFKTGGCCDNTDLSIDSLINAETVLNWDDLPGIYEYELRWREIGNDEWQIENVDGPPYSFEKAKDCTDYEAQIKTVCSSGIAEFGPSFFFTSKNCGLCLDVNYCEPNQYFESFFGHITKVGINGIDNVSQDDNGYGDFGTRDGQEISIGASFELELGGEDYYYSFLNWNVWIDFNANGRFENNEMVVSENFQNDLSLNIMVPDDAVEGLTRMRVVLGSGVPNNPCHDDYDFEYGETEDYCVRIVEGPSQTTSQTLGGITLQINPNPFEDYIFFDKNELPDSDFKIRIVDISGITRYADTDFYPEKKLDLSSLTDGVYFLRIFNENFSLDKKIIKQSF